MFKGVFLLLPADQVHAKQSGRWMGASGVEGSTGAAPGVG